MARPLAWSAIGASAAFRLGMTEDLALAAAGLIGALARLVSSPRQSRIESGGQGAAMLIEKYLPSFDAGDRHETAVAADPEHAYAALRSFDLYRSRLVRWIFAIRTIPSRLRGRTSAPAPGTPFLDQALAVGWKVLEEEPGRELVAGAVTQPWAPIVRFQGMSAPEFLAFREPGYTKIAWNIAVRSAGPGRVILGTETRVAATDPASRRKFRLYWFFLSPAIRLIRLISLRLVRRDLQRVPIPARTA